MIETRSKTKAARAAKAINTKNKSTEQVHKNTTIKVLKAREKIFLKLKKNDTNSSGLEYLGSVQRQRILLRFKNPNYHQIAANGDCLSNATAGKLKTL
ncbi:hypothetical protein BN7_2955 [Wickerhamomyces ciferrii]|uniref:Uncharacterized protein n=1 Tax=Wickerhamomyces ciferrii (strain ATCC 14091 / BCRC 22168 / CBS 111 / JCM 3599 / NBRC 0793 / NRRL Y-1031 F-60-10) TaxID=1206466 RepID=K0KMH7_WICCF|nr:uncharacterized protein BN7_2955 [Wickerhamomyces ciferrii]CCH43407.1 hypothetical protein BN7_2955 [Wickerhamomyces ciferrii]